MAALGGVRRTTLLLVLAAVVLGFGLVIGDRPAAGFSETAQADARASAVELAEQAAALAGSASGALSVELAHQAEVLAEQTTLLSSHGTDLLPAAVRTSGSAVQDARTAAGDGGTAAYVASLSASAAASLDAALRADPGTARLLASTGTAQAVLAQRAAGEAGLAAPAAWHPLAAGTTDPRCPDGAEADSTEADSAEVAGAEVAGAEAADPAAPDAAAALQTAVDAEYGAAYAYEVAMARAAAAGTAAAFGERREVHLDAGADGVGLLPQVCRPALTPVPSYLLPESLRTDPRQALAELEAALPFVYADLTALGTGPVRAWAVERLVQVAADLYVGAASVPAAPGLEAEPEGLPWAMGSA